MMNGPVTRPSKWLSVRVIRSRLETQQEWEANLMQRIMIGTLMALFLGLFSMPASQAAPANGVAIGSAADANTLVEKSQWWGRRRRGCWHRWRSRRGC